MEKFDEFVLSKHRVIILIDNRGTAQSSPQSKLDNDRAGRRATRPRWIYYAQFEQLLPIEPVGPMVKRKKTSPTSEEHEMW